MLQVFVPENFFPERSYILDVLLGEFLGLEFQVFIAPEKEYRIVCENGNELIIRDDFFGSIKEETYLNKENLPNKIKILGQSPIYDRSLPIIFGEDYLSITQNSINCGADFFASSFFLLTRWEEYVCPQIKGSYEEANRFVLSSRLYKRPLVNEYVECLWEMLKYLKIQQERKSRNFSIKLSHNVLHLERWRSFSRVFTNVAKDIFSHRNWQYAFKDLVSFTNVKCKGKLDPFNNFDDIMQISEKWGVKSQFNLMAKRKASFDCSYEIKDNETMRLVDKIKSRGHDVGLLGSYLSYNQVAQSTEEKTFFDKTFQFEVAKISPLGFRFENPTTWQIASDLKYKEISSAALSSCWGFQSGVCYSFSVFNILSRKKLSLKESPLIIHDQGLEGGIPGLTVSKVIEKIERLKNLVRRYDGDLVVNWQNAHFKTPQWENYQSAYESLFV
ncbi:Uncharacterized protein AB751O23_AO_00080 [Chlamydiales bacterium SCGC AB-751-O23]|jgi:hypothetical protein|nr:Uncharacterized protein AB751O23_AO_00080 [Chlamydiales bacterium SCGC AB-751-O23]